MESGGREDGQRGPSRPPSSIEALDRREKRDLADYFLHRFCGYTFDPEGRVGAVTRQEAQRLFDGHKLWNRHVENNDEDKKAGQRVTAGDEKAFDEYAKKVNAKRNGGPSPPHSA